MIRFRLGGENNVKIAVEGSPRVLVHILFPPPLHV